MPLTLAVAQCITKDTKEKTLQLLSDFAHEAGSSNVDLLLFPEAFIGGYPRGSTFGCAIGARTDAGRDAFADYWAQAADLGDVCPEGSGRYDLPGDGSRQRLEEVARDSGVFLAVGLVERAGGSLWCAVLYVCPQRGVVGKRRKLMPTAGERVVWAQGSPATLKAVTAELGTPKQHVVLAAAICWENYMPLLRASLYAQGVTVYLAPTADARESWLSTMQHVALEGRCYVLGANQFVPEDGKGGAAGACPGGSVIYDPLGKCVAGPLWGGEWGEEWAEEYSSGKLLKVEIEDLEREVVRAKLDFDSAAGGHYARSDVFKLAVEGLELTRKA
ncbi:carbon-nitrogen hydrolase [Geopyxis carbonaria]|nr:carbon-nitrogen hydrolase [Geopyxis carbonaria]